MEFYQRGQEAALEKLGFLGKALGTLAGKWNALKPATQGLAKRLAVGGAAGAGIGALTGQDEKPGFMGIGGQEGTRGRNALIGGLLGAGGMAGLGHLSGRGAHATQTAANKAMRGLSGFGPKTLMSPTEAAIANAPYNAARSDILPGLNAKFRQAMQAVAEHPGVDPRIFG